MGRSARVWRACSSAPQRSPESESLDGLRLLLMPERGDHSQAIETTKASTNPPSRTPSAAQSDPDHKAIPNATALISSSTTNA